jgi:kumamolisin
MQLCEKIFRTAKLLPNLFSKNSSNKESPQVEALKVPQELSDLVQGVFGLDNRQQASPKFRVFRNISGKRISPRASSSSFNPNELGPIYRFPTDADGTGQCVGIIELGGGYRQTDLDTYFKSIGITQPVNVSSVSIDGATNFPLNF